MYSFLGATGKCAAAHSIMREQLEAYLNRHCNLAQIVYLLHETYEPLVSISRLPSIPQLGVNSSVSTVTCFQYFRVFQ